MRSSITILLVQLALAFCAGATPDDLQDIHGPFSSSNATFDGVRPRATNNTSRPSAHITGMFCKRDGPICSPITLTPQVNVTGSWTNDAESDIQDIDYFRFSEDNVLHSEADAWYATWTQIRQNDSEWAELGEWKLFAKDFAQTYNFECDLTFGSCINQPSLGDLQRMWPGSEHRAMVRRIYFTFERYRLAHAYVNAIEEAYDRTHLFLIGMVPEIISTFTLQVDPAKKLKCDIIHTVISTLANIGIQLAQVVFIGLLTPELVPFGKLGQTAMDKSRELKETLAQTTDAATRTSLKLQINSLRAEAKAHPRGHLRWLNTPLFKTDRTREMNVRPSIVWSNVALYNFGILQSAGYTEYKKAHDMKFKSMGPGIAHGIVCSDFEGDFVDNSAGNRDMLNARLSSVFESARKQRQALFRAFYKGYIAEPGQSSGTAMWLATRDWTGPGSVLEDMRDISGMEEEIKSALVKGLITDTLTSDYNYIKCGYKDDAAAHCKKAETATKGKDLSVFCPHPDTDPQFMCDSRRWYFADRKSHDIPMVAAKKFESFAGNRFNLTRQKFLMESFHNYELYTHDNPTDHGAWPYGESKGEGIGFNLPVCVSDRPRFFEKGGYPSICGDWKASETASFVDAMNAGVNSSIFTYRHKKKPNVLFSAIIPHALNESPPITRYLGMCANNLRFPQDTDKDGKGGRKGGIQLSRDSDCDLIENGVKDMTSQEDANRWFCTNVAGHSIFKRERIQAQTKHDRWIYNHDTMCRTWLKTNGMEPKDADRAGT